MQKVRDVIQKDSAWNIRLMWDDNIKMIIKEAGCEDVD
jgi:hypothetical protein